MPPRPQNVDGYACEGCGKKCSTRQAKYSHKRHCKLMLAGGGNKSVLEELAKLTDALAKLKLGKITINNITTNNNGDTIILNKFGFEDRSMFTRQQIRALIQSGDFKEVLQELIKTMHFNEAHPENMNVYVPNTKVGFVFRKHMWNQGNAESIVLDVMRNVVEVLEDYRQSVKELKMKKSDLEVFTRFLQNFQWESENITRSMRTLIDHHKMVEQILPPNIVQATTEGK